MNNKTFKNLYKPRKPFVNRRTLEAKIKGYSDYFDIDVYNIRDKKPDCKVGHFGYNLYFRTNKGSKCLEYKSLKTLKSAVIQKAKLLGLVIEGFFVKVEYRQNYNRLAI